MTDIEKKNHFKRLGVLEIVRLSDEEFTEYVTVMERIPSDVVHNVTASQFKILVDSELAKLTPEELEEFKKEFQEDFEYYRNLYETNKKEYEEIDSLRNHYWFQAMKYGDREVNYFPIIGLAASGIAGLVTGFVSRFMRDGGNLRKVDDVREYYLTHPEAFAKAQEITGSTDLDYISGWALGSDSAAEALYVATGLKDFFWDNFCAACVDAGLVAAALLTIPPLTITVWNAVNDIFYKKYHKKEKEMLAKSRDPYKKMEAVEGDYKLRKAAMECLEKGEKPYLIANNVFEYFKSRVENKKEKKEAKPLVEVRAL